MTLHYISRSTATTVAEPIKSQYAVGKTGRETGVGDQWVKPVDRELGDHGTEFFNLSLIATLLVQGKYIVFI